jgi:hypothetical protein
MYSAERILRPKKSTIKVMFLSTPAWRTLVRQEFHKLTRIQNYLFHSILKSIFFIGCPLPTAFYFMVFAIFSHCYIALTGLNVRPVFFRTGRCPVLFYVALSGQKNSLSSNLNPFFRHVLCALRHASLNT